MKLKLKMSMMILAEIKKCLIWVFIWKYYDDSNKLFIRKMKDETGGLANEELVGLKPKMYSFLVGNSDHKKAKGVNGNIIVTKS